jgi:hypothetical protein
MSDFVPVNDIQPAPRPGFLKVLCILSFISLGFGAISSLTSLLNGPQSDDAMLEMKEQLSESIDQMREQGSHGFADFFLQLQGLLVDTNDHHALSTGIGVFIVGLGFFSVIRMWNGQRLGFYLYIAYSLASIFSMYLYVSSDHIPTAVPIFGLVISGIFIFMYSRNLHWMK